MADDLSLLLKIKGDASGGVKAAADTRAAIATLRANSTTEFSQMSRVATTALGGITNSLTALSSRTPVVGTAVSALSTQFTTMAGTSAAAGSSLAAMALPAILAATAIGGAVTATIALGKGLFDLAKSTAEYAGKLNDVSKQTNFTVETLSALTLAAKTSGGSLDSIAGSLGIFQSNMVKAAEGNKGLAKTFRDLKIDTTDQEKALRQAMAALFAMGETEKQSATAKQLFGRAGKEVLGVIKETNGDLDKAIAKYQQMNLLVSTEAAIAADRFSDSLELLNEQLAGVGRTIGFAVIPVLTVFLNDMSEGLNGSREGWDLWARVIQSAVATALAAADTFVRFMREPFLASQAGLGNLFEGTRDALLARSGQQQIADTVSAVTDRAGQRSLAGIGSGGGGGGKGSTPKSTFLQDALKDAALTERQALVLNAGDVEENKRALDDQIRDIKEFTDRAKKLADDRQDAVIVRINAEQEALDAALAKKLIKRKEYDEKDKELSIRNQEAQQKNTEEIFRLEQERDRQISAAELAAKERELRLAEDADNRQIQRIKNRVARGILLESEGEQQIAAILDEGFARRRLALEAEETAYATTLQRRTAITDELIRLDGERAGAAEDAAERIARALFDEQNAAAKGATRKRRTTDPDNIDLNGPTGAIDQLFKAIDDNLTGDTHTAALAGLTAMTDAFSGLGQAVGRVVQSFVLYGTAGASVRQVTAQILASIAQQAAIKAVFELAEGFAALALAFFGVPNAGPSATAHFTAAAIYGTIAGVAAIAGRVVAGDSFKQQSSGGSGGSGSSSGSGGSGRSSSKPGTQDFNRRNMNIPEVRVSFAPGVEDFLEAKILKRVRQPGELRDAIGNK